MKICKRWVGKLGVGYIQDETETWDKVVSKESKEFTLVMTLNIGDMEPEEDTSCSQAVTTEE